MRILLVEDDDLLAEGIRAGLIQNGHAVDRVDDGEKAEHALSVEAFDVLILDLGLPGRDGFEVLRSLRNAGKELPVLILTARDEVDDRIKGLDLGADDYLCKPCDLNELSARIRALARRGRGRSAPLLKYGDLELDPARQEVRKQGTLIDVSPHEYTLLQTLAESVERTVTRERLLQSLYAWDAEVESNTLAVHIHHLRKKLGRGLIQTVRGVGYRLGGRDGI